jgi:hypothetical protein
MTNKESIMKLMKTNKRLRPGLIFGVAVVAWLVMPPIAQAQEAHKKAHNMRLVGTNDLQARSAYQPIVQHQLVGGVDKYIAYIGHHNGSAPNTLLPGAPVQTNGVSIVDVTDPKRPVYLHHIPGAAGAQMVRACSGDELPFGISGKTYLLRSDGNVAHEVWDVTNPSAPALLSTPVANLDGTHKNYWECSTGYAYIVSGVVAGTTLPGQPPVAFQDWRTNRMTQIFDLSDPANPVFIRNFGLVGQQPGATGDEPQSLHGCIPVIERNRVYCGHGTRANGILVILDREELLHPTIPLADPANPTVEELQAPLITRFDTPTFMGAHTTFPVLGYSLPQLGPVNTERDFIVLVNEAIANECNENRQMTFMVDITDEAHPYPVSNINVSEAEGNYCTVGGRFGSHASHESFTDVYYRKMVFISWFNAGVRGIDIRDPFNPQEVAYFIPRITENTDDRNGKFAIQTNNVEVDDRGFIYTTDRANTGLHILALTGKAKKIADLP